MDAARLRLDGFRSSGRLETRDITSVGRDELLSFDRLGCGNLRSISRPEHGRRQMISLPQTRVLRHGGSWEHRLGDHHEDEPRKEGDCKEHCDGRRAVHTTTRADGKAGRSLIHGATS